MKTHRSKTGRDGGPAACGTGSAGQTRGHIFTTADPSKVTCGRCQAARTHTAPDPNKQRREISREISRIEANRWMWEGYPSEAFWLPRLTELTSALENLNRETGS